MVKWSNKQNTFGKISNMIYEGVSTDVCIFVCNYTYWQVLFLLQCCLLLPQPISELVNSFVHGSHFQVAFIQALSLMLQLGVLLKVELVPQLIAIMDKTS